MAVALLRVQNLISLSVSHIALNPVVTASLLWALTRGPLQIRNRLISQFKPLRDPQGLARVLRVLKALLAIGLLGLVNKQLNRIALNAWRVRSEKKRWIMNQEIAVVTGGCSGIGERIVKGLVNQGVRVAVLDIHQLPLGLQGYANIKFFACDITDSAAVKSTAERIRTTFGSPTILVNNAGIAQVHTILQTEDDWLLKIFKVNLLSNFTTVKAFLPSMIENNKGHIITMGSTATYLGVAGMADYCCTKTGVLAFHESLNQELKLHHNAPNVLTTSVHPNWARTPLLEPFQKGLRAANSPLIEPQAVADAVIKQIVNASGGQIFLPHIARNVSYVRGLPNWVQEYFRAVPSKTVLQNLA